MKAKAKALHILLIEDNDEHAEIVLRHIRRIESMTVMVTRVSLLGKGLQLLVETRFDAILLDLHLPDSDFMETLPRITKVTTETPVIVLSALDDRDSTIKAAQEGASDFLNKAQLSSEILVRTILSSIERKESELKIKHQLHQTALLSELSQFALNEVIVDKVKLRCREILMNSLLVDFVSFAELPEIGRKSLDRRDRDGVPFIFSELEFLGM